MPVCRLISQGIFLPTGVMTGVVRLNAMTIV